jgi:hypothetical protein
MKRKTQINTALTQDIINSRNAIREKYKKLKLDREQQDELLTKTLKPITEPLEKLLSDKKKLVSVEKNSRGSLSTVATPHKLTPLDDTVNVFDESIEFGGPYETEDQEQIFSSENENTSDDEFESVHENDESENEAYNTPERHRKAKKIVSEAGAIAKDYMLMLLQNDMSKQLDNAFGIRRVADGFKLGDTDIKIYKDEVKVGDTTVEGTPGLYELLFKKIPNIRVYSAKDLEVYKNLLLQTSAHLMGNNPESRKKTNGGYKYKNIIKPLFFPPTTGQGMNIHAPRIEYWDDPNELVDRLRLLIASQAAGNTSHQNEILSIIEELREADFII